MGFVKKFFDIFHVTLPRGDEPIGVRFFSHGAKAMRLQFIPSIIVPLLVLLIARSPFAKETSARYHLTIVYTNDVQGEIEPCG